MHKSLAVTFMAGLLTVGMALEGQALLNCDNFKPYEEISYSMPLFRGQCGEGTLTVKNITSGSEGAAVQHEGRYKALADLVWGTNVIEFSCGGEKMELPVVLKRMPSDNVVKFYYVIPKGGNGDFYTPPGYTGENTNYFDRFDRAAKIMQTFSAHDLDDHPWRFGKKTFNLELDGNMKVMLHVVTSAYTKAELQSYRKADGKSFDNFKYHAKMREAVGHDYKNLNPAVQYVVVGNTTELRDGIWVGHTATGGGGLGAFGSGALYTWPTSLKGVFECFLDNTVMDPKTEVDDSCSRHRRWAHFATTLGATIHENGHALGLPHFYGKYVIMSRGHDQLNRVFTFFDPPTARVPSTNYFDVSEIGHWSDSAAAFLNEHPFFNPNRSAKGEGPKILKGRQPSTIILEDESGIVWYAYKDSDAYHFSDTVCFEKPYPKRLSITRLPGQCEGSGATFLVASNGKGYKSEKTIEDISGIRSSYSLKFRAADGFALGPWQQGAQKSKAKDGVFPILRSDSKAELVRGPKEGEFVLQVYGTGNGVKIPANVGEENLGLSKSSISLDCTLAPVLGHTIIDLKDRSGVSFLYLEYGEKGDLIIHHGNGKGGYAGSTIKGAAKTGSQKIAMELDLESRTVKRLSLNGEDILKGRKIFLQSPENFISSVWLKNTSGKERATFESLNLKLNK